jgi:hypothetical protein
VTRNFQEHCRPSGAQSRPRILNQGLTPQAIYSRPSGASKLLICEAE